MRENSSLQREKEECNPKPNPNPSHLFSLSRSLFLIVRLYTQPEDHRADAPPEQLLYAAIDDPDDTGRQLSSLSDLVVNKKDKKKDKKGDKPPTVKGHPPAGPAPAPPSAKGVCVSVSCVNLDYLWIFVDFSSIFLWIFSLIFSFVNEPLAPVHALS